MHFDAFRVFTFVLWTAVVRGENHIVIEARPTLRVGVTISTHGALVVNEFNRKCNYCAGVNYTFQLWRNKVNSLDLPFLVGLVMEDDEMDHTLCKSHYENFAEINATTGRRNVDVLFGPSLASFNQIAARIAAENDMLLIVWSTNFWLSMHSQPRAEFDLKPRIDSSGAASAPALATYEPEPGPSYDAYASPSATAVDLERPFDIFSLGSESLFDVNVEQIMWSTDALQKTYDAGHKRFIFVWSTTSREGSEWFEAECQQARSTLAVIEYRDWVAQEAEGSYESDLELIPWPFAHDDLLRQIGFLMHARPDAIIFCGGLGDAVPFLLGLKGYSLNPGGSGGQGAMVLTRPLGLELVRAIYGFNANNIVEAYPIPVPDPERPDAVFNTYAEFENDFREGRGILEDGNGRSSEGDGEACFWITNRDLISRRRRRNQVRDPFDHNFTCTNRTPTAESENYVFYVPEKPDIPALGAAAAGALLTEALRGVGADAIVLLDSVNTTDVNDTTLSEFASNISQYIRGHPVNSVMGELSYPSWGGPGKRKPEGATSSRQIIPYTMERDDMRDARMRYEVSSLQFVSDVSCGNTIFDTLGSQPNCITPEPVHLDTWYEKELQVYPCKSGCSWSSQNLCVPCAPGRFRGDSDLLCVPCKSGMFADGFGLSACLDCPPGAECGAQNTSDKTPRTEPLPKPGFYQMFSEQNTSLQGNCANASESVPIYTFKLCDPPSVCEGGSNPCVGDNTGTFCGQCIETEHFSFQGLFPGFRVCKNCEAARNQNLAIGVVVLVLLFLTLRRVSNLGVVAANQIGYVPFPIVRNFIHYVHLLGCILESMKLDATLAAYPLGWVDILYRPLDLMNVACMLPSDERGGSIIVLRQMSMMMLPAGIGAIIFLRLCGQGLSACMSSIRSHPRGSMALSMAAPTDGGDSEITPLNPQHSLAAANHKWCLRDTLHTFQKQFRDICRDCIVWIILTSPIAMRGCMRSLFCRSFSALGQTYLRADYSISCETDEHKEILGNSNMAKYLIMIVPPLLLAVGTFIVRKDTWSLPVRRTWAILFDGYRPQHIYWEALLVFRTSFIIYLAHGGWYNSSTVLNGLYIITTLVVFLIFHILKKPCDNRGRDILKRSEYQQLAVLMLTTVLGLVYQLKFDAALPGEPGAAIDGGSIPEWLALLILFVVVVANYLVVGKVVLHLMFDVGIQLQALTADGSFMDGVSKASLQCINATHGVSPVSLVQEKGGVFIDVSELNESERRFLVAGLRQLLHACMCGDEQFHTSLLENAINHAFSRAAEGRAAILRSQYEKNGVSQWALVHLVRGCIRVTLRAPDIPSKAGAEEQAPARTVTVEELHNSLESVIADILDRHPSFNMQGQQKAHVRGIADKKAAPSPNGTGPAPEVIGATDAGDRAGKEEDEVREPTEWLASTPLQMFEEDLEQQGTIVMNAIQENEDDEEREEITRDQGPIDHGILNEMRIDTNNYEGEHQHGKSEKQLADELEEKQAMVKQLTEKLREVDPIGLANHESFKKATHRAQKIHEMQAHDRAHHNH